MMVNLTIPNVIIEEVQKQVSLIMSLEWIDAAVEVGDDFSQNCYHLPVLT